MSIFQCFATRYKTPTVCRYVRLGRTRYMVVLRPFDIFLATLEIRYVAYGNERRLRLVLLAPQGISSALAPYRTRSVYRAVRQRRISTSSRRVRRTTLSTWAGTPKGIKIGQKRGWKLQKVSKPQVEIIICPYFSQP